MSNDNTRMHYRLATGAKTGAISGGKTTPQAYAKGGFVMNKKVGSTMVTHKGGHLARGHKMMPSKKGVNC